MSCEYRSESGVAWYLSTGLDLMYIKPVRLQCISTCSVLYSYMYHYVNKLSNRNAPYMLFDVNFNRFHCHRLTYTIAVIMISWKYLALTIIIMFCAFWKFAVSIRDFYRKCSPQRLVHWTMDALVQKVQAIYTFYGGHGIATMGFSTQVHDHAHVICLKGGLSRSV